MPYVTLGYLTDNLSETTALAPSPVSFRPAYPMQPGVADNLLATVVSNTISGGSTAVKMTLLKNGSATAITGTFAGGFTGLKVFTGGPISYGPGDTLDILVECLDDSTGNIVVTATLDYTHQGALPNNAVVVASGSQVMLPDTEYDLAVVAHVIGRVYQVFTWVGQGADDRIYANSIDDHSGSAPTGNPISWRLIDGGAGFVKLNAKNWYSANRTFYWAIVGLIP